MKVTITTDEGEVLEVMKLPELPGENAEDVIAKAHAVRDHIAFGFEVEED